MATELVLLSDIEPRTEIIARAAAQLHPEGRYIEYRGGEIGQFVSADGTALLNIFRSRPVGLAREAAAAVREAPRSFALWTDMTIPFGDPSGGRELAETIAGAVDGLVRERV